MTVCALRVLEKAILATRLKYHGPIIGEIVRIRGRRNGCKSVRINGSGSIAEMEDPIAETKGPKAKKVKASRGILGELFRLLSEGTSVKNSSNILRIIAVLICCVEADQKYVGCRPDGMAESVTL